MGGLGNQIFQLCFAHALSKRNEIVLSIIKSKSIHNKDSNDYYNNIFKNFQNVDKIDPTCIETYHEPKNNFSTFNPDIIDIKNYNKFVGYFQNEKYFIDYKDDIIKLLTSNSVYDKILKFKNNSYFIHIRRGDYVNHNVHYINLDIYYSNAIKYITNIDKNPHFYIISDDVTYCKNYDVIKDINKTFYENPNEVETLYFMSLCSKGGICGNSTFAWWGSYLNTNPNKIVTFPDKWINFEIDNDIYYNNSAVLPTQKTEMTVVSGYWIINNKYNNKYENWFKNTLNINCPYVFFGDTETINMVKKYRKNFPTYYINCKIEEFYTYKYYDNIITDNYHCPSKELNLIWNEKVFLIQKAKNINPFNSSFFTWIDSGICIYRDKNPPTKMFPDNEKIKGLPYDKFIFTTSDSDTFKKDDIGVSNHYISGTSFMTHLNFIDSFVDIYKKYLEIYLTRKDKVYTDQIILTLIYAENPDLFYKIGDGYGKLVEILY